MSHTDYTDFALMLPCGMRISVHQLGPNGASQQGHEHAYEHVWCVEMPAKVLGRGYDADKATALGKAIECAKQVLAESNTMLEHVIL